MVKRVLIIGGYGNFGRFIAKRLATDATIQLIIAGRHIQKAILLCNELTAPNPPELAQIDIHDRLAESLAKIVPDIVIHDLWTYQQQGYGCQRMHSAKACHYIDIADAREFVWHYTIECSRKSKNIGLFWCKLSALSWPMRLLITFNLLRQNH